MANIAPSDILVVQRPAGADAGTYKTPFSDLINAMIESDGIWQEEADGLIHPINPDGFIDGGVYA